MAERGKEQFPPKEGVGVPCGPTEQSLSAVSVIFMDVIFILLPKGFGETGGGNSIPAQARCRQNQP